MTTNSSFEIKRQTLIGETTDTKNLVLNFHNKEVANLPLSALSTESPVYNRKWKKNKIIKKNKIKKDFNSLKIYDCLKKILQSPNNTNKSWVWEQYDNTVMGDTVQKPGGDAGVVRIHGTSKGVAMTVDS